MSNADRPAPQLAEIRRAVADYMRSEGCSCCQNVEEHKAAEAVLAKLLHVPKYSDGTGYNFYRFATKRKAEIVNG